MLNASPTVRPGGLHQWPAVRNLGVGWQIWGALQSAASLQSAIDASCNYLFCACTSKKWLIHFLALHAIFSKAELLALFTGTVHILNKTKYLALTILRKLCKKEAFSFLQRCGREGSYDIGMGGARGCITPEFSSGHGYVLSFSHLLLCFLHPAMCCTQPY